ncbi:MAG: DUF4384 domain-containing protein, partial [Planctomycetota bacterium]
MKLGVLVVIAGVALLAAAAGGWLMTRSSPNAGGVSPSPTELAEQHDAPTPLPVEVRRIREDTQVETLEPRRTPTPPAERVVEAVDRDAQPAPIIDADTPAPGTPPRPAPDGPPGLAVLPFKHVGTIRPDHAGTTLAQMLVAEIDSGKYTLFERGQLDRLLGEQRFQAGDLVDDSSVAARFGQLAGIRYLVLGELSSLGTTRWTARVIDCQTGAIRERGAVSVDPSFRDADRASVEMVALLELNDAAVTLPAPPAPPTPDRPTPAPTPPTDDRPIADRRQLVGDDLIEAFNPDAAFSIRLATGEGKTEYAEGETLSFEVESDADCFITLITIDPQGDAMLLLPNRWQPRAFAPAGVALTLPTPSMGFKFTVKPPHGLTRVRAIATTRPIRLRGVTSKDIGTQGFVSLGNQKAIGIEGVEGGPPAPSQDAALDELFGPHEWTTAELAVTTRSQAVRGGGG